MNDKDIEHIQQEVHTPNKAKRYECRKSKPVELPVGIQVTELKISHHNYLLESKTNPTLDDYINVKHKSLFEKLKGLFT